MTKSKIERLVKELIEKYGDKVVYQEYDLYKSRLIENDDYVGIAGSIIKEVRLSEIDNIFCREDLKQLEDLLKSDQKVSVSVKLEDSKKLYDAHEQEKLRKKKEEEINKMLGAYKQFFYNPFYTSLFEKPQSSYNISWR